MMNDTVEIEAKSKAYDILKKMGIRVQSKRCGGEFTEIVLNVKKQNTSDEFILKKQFQDVLNLQEVLNYFSIDDTDKTDIEKALAFDFVTKIFDIHYTDKDYFGIYYVNILFNDCACYFNANSEFFYLIKQGNYKDALSLKTN